MILSMLDKMNKKLPFDNYKLLIGSVLTAIGFYMNPDVSAVTQIIEFINGISGTDVFHGGLVAAGFGGAGKIPKLKPIPEG